MLKRPKECLHQQKNVDLRIRSIWKHQTDFILDVRITNLDAPSETGCSSPFPRTRKEEIPPILPGPRPSLLYLQWSASKWSQGSTVLQNLTGSLDKNLQLHEGQGRALQLYEPRIYASEDHMSPLWAEWKMEPACFSRKLRVEYLR